MQMKKISVMIPCYNEEENVVPMSRAIADIFREELPEYDYELLFIDNDSRDATRTLLRQICAENPRVRVIFNAKNFGQFNSPYHGMLQTSGDCTIGMCCDFQDPVELIPRYVKEWENGYKIVIGVKTGSKDNMIVYRLRSMYYKLLQKFSSIELIEHFTGSGLYDHEFIEVLRQLKDPMPFLRGIVAEFGYGIKKIPYEQPARRAGKTHNNWYTLYDAAMLSVTTYTKVGMRIATFSGIACGFVSTVAAIVYLVLKLLFWEQFAAGMAPILIGMFFLGSVQLFFLGFLGEYISSMNQRIINRPLVIEQERINFGDPDKIVSVIDSLHSEKVRELNEQGMDEK